jgi:hypothetical protein
MNADEYDDDLPQLELPELTYPDEVEDVDIDSPELGQFAEAFGLYADELSADIPTTDEMEINDTPDLGNFSRDFSLFVAQSMDRVAGMVPDGMVDSSFEQERIAAWDEYNATKGTEFHVVSGGGNGQVNEWATFAMRSEANQPRWRETKDYAGRCNCYVHDVGTSAGLRMPTPGGVPANTDYWVHNGGNGIRCWKESQDPGTVFAFNSPNSTGPSTHHMGIIENSDTGETVSAGNHGVSDFAKYKYDAEGTARFTQGPADQNDMSNHAEVHFYDYTCPDFRPFEQLRRP